MSTVHVSNVGGFSVMAPNVCNNFGTFYISYNDWDTDIYGCDTTAIVVGQMERFYVLNGDHREQLHAIAEKKGLDGCVQYFLDHIDEKSKYSDMPGWPG